MEDYFEQFTISEDFRKALNKQPKIDSHEKQFIKLRKEFNDDIKQLESRYESKIKSLKQQLESTSR